MWPPHPSQRKPLFVPATSAQLANFWAPLPSTVEEPLDFSTAMVSDDPHPLVKKLLATSTKQSGQQLYAPTSVYEQSLSEMFTFSGLSTTAKGSAEPGRNKGKQKKAAKTLELVDSDSGEEQEEEQEEQEEQEEMAMEQNSKDRADKEGDLQQNRQGSRKKGKVSEQQHKEKKKHVQNGKQHKKQQQQQQQERQKKQKKEVHQEESEEEEDIEEEDEDAIRKARRGEEIEKSLSQEVCVCIT